MITIKTWIKIIFSVCALLIIILLVSNKQLIHILLSGDLEEFFIRVDDQFLPMVIITFILMMIQNIITFIPLILILTVNITFYGFIYGLMWSWLTSIFAATLIFMSVRYFFKDLLEKRISDAIKEKAEKNGFMYVLLVRIFPLVPTNLVNIVSGVSTIKFKDFLLATSIGNFIYLFVLSLVPLGLLSVDTELMIFLVAFVIFAIFVYKKYKKQQALKKESDI